MTDQTNEPLVAYTITLTAEQWAWLMIEVAIRERDLRNQNTGDAERLDETIRSLISQTRNDDLIDTYLSWRK